MSWPNTSISGYQIRTWKAARITQSAPIIPTSTQGKMLQSVSAWPVLEFAALKKVVRHLDSALECLEAEMIIQAAATENPADKISPWRVTYLLYVVGFSCDTSNKCAAHQQIKSSHTLETPMKPIICTATPAYAKTPRIHLAKEGVEAPTTKQE